MGITADEALAQLDAAKKPLTADEALALLDADETQDYSLGEQVGELGREVVRGAGTINADLVDIAGNLLSTGPALGATMKETVFGDEKILDLPKNVYERALRYNEEFGTDRGGKMLKQAVAENFAAEIPEDASGEGFERWRTAARIGGESLNPLLIVGGPANAVRGTIGAMAGGTYGEEVGGTTGEIIGSVLGDLTGTGLLRNPKTSVDLVKNMARGAGNVWDNLKSFLPGGSPLNKVENATLDDLAQAIDVIKLNASVPREIAGMADGQAKMDAIEVWTRELEQQIVDAVETNQLGSIGQITGNPGLENYARVLREATEKSGTSPQAIASREAQAQTNIRLQDEVDRYIDEVAPTGVAERAMDAPKEKLAKSKAALREEGYTAGQSAEVDAQSRLAKTRAAEKTRQEVLHKQYLDDATAPGADAPTKIGREGVNELREGFQKAYTKAWEGATSLPSNVSDKLSKRITSLSKTYGGDEARILSKVQAEIQKLTQGVTPDKMKSLDNAFRRAEQSAANVSGELAQDIADLRKVFRAGVPAPVKAELAKIDAKYPKYLTVKGAANRAREQGGVFTSSQVATESGLVNARTLPFEETYVPAKVQKTAAELAETEAEAVTRAAKTQAAELRRGADTDIKAIDRTPSGKLAATDAAGVDEVVKTIARGGTAKNRTKALTDLLDSVKDNPKGREDIRRAFAKQFRNTFDDSGAITQKGKDDFDKMRKVYKDSGMFTDAELKNYDNAIKEGQKLYIDTGKMPAKMPEGAQPLAETLAALAGAKVGALAFGSPLIGAALGRKATTKALQKMSGDRLNDLAYELMVHPSKYVDLLDKVKMVNITQKEFNTVLKEMFSRLPAIAGREADNTEGK